MPDEQSPLQDRDIMLGVIQQTVAFIMNDVANISDITNDAQKAKLFKNITGMMDELGVAVNTVFPQEIAEAYVQGHTMGGNLLAESGQTQIAGDLQNKVHTQAVQDLAVRGVSDLLAAIRTATISMIGGITNTLQNVQNAMTTGLIAGSTTKQITKMVQQQFFESGMTSFITSDGRALPLDFYSMTVTRTKVRDAHTQGAVNRYNENNIDLVRFNNRSYTCHVCGARQHLIVSTQGNTPGYPTAEEIGGLPPFHPNCKHYPIPVTDPTEYPPIPFTGADIRSAKSKKMYKDEQDIRRKANAEKKLYMKMKAEADAAGQSFPSIGSWRRSKRKNDAKWKELQASYRQSIAELKSSLPGPGPKERSTGNAQRHLDAINTLRTQLAEARPPEQAAGAEMLSPFKTPNLQYEEKGGEIFIEGKSSGAPSSSESRATAMRLLGAPGHKAMLEVAYELEDAGTLEGFAYDVYKDLDSLYKKRDALFDVKDHHVLFSADNVEKIGKVINAVPITSLPRPQQRAVELYTGSNSTEMNQHFRKGKDIRPDLLEDTKQLDAAIAANELTENVMLYRGADYKAIGGAMAKDILSGGADKYIGATIQDMGFMSTSLGATTRFQDKVGFQIKAPKGTKGLYVEEITYTEGEQEVILPRGTTMRIVEIKKDGSNIEFLMEVMPDE